MGLNIGNTSIGGIYLGNTKISEAYLGSTKIYSAAAPTPTDEVQIGNQIWKSKNLAIDDGQGGISTQTVNYGQGDVVEYYYTWDAAVRVANSISGWHLPTQTEMYTTLRRAVSADAGTKLKSTYGWLSGNGTDDFGFTAFPAGSWTSGGGFGYLGERARFWTSTEHSSYNTNAYYCEFRTDSSSMSSGTFSKKTGCSIRLVKDAT